MSRAALISGAWTGVLLLYLTGVHDPWVMVGFAAGVTFTAAAAE